MKMFLSISKQNEISSILMIHAIENKKNLWEENFPARMADVIEFAENITELLMQKLNDSSCLKLSELYESKNGKTFASKSMFDSYSQAPNSKLNSKVNKLNEHQGIYLLASEESSKFIPQYVGISRTIKRRLRQHAFGKLHNEATLAYLMAKSENSHSALRSLLDRGLIQRHQELIREYKVSFMAINHPYYLYFTEVYVAGKLGLPWNSFKTH